MGDCYEKTRHFHFKAQQIEARQVDTDLMWKYSGGLTLVKNFVDIRKMGR